MSHVGRRPPRGFTLVELMIVVGIIGILATVAIPSFAKLQVRSKVAERALVMLSIKKAFDERFIRTGQITPAGSTLDVGPFQPAGTPGPSKRMPDWHAAGWKDLNVEIEGATYYSYMFQASGTGVPQTLVILANGDVDGDGRLSLKAITYQTSQAGVQWVGEAPAAGLEDDATYGTF